MATIIGSGHAHGTAPGHPASPLHPRADLRPPRRLGVRGHVPPRRRRRGCGSARLVVQIAARRPDLRVHGIDLERGMVDVATRHAERADVGGRVALTVADLADLPLPDDSVDLIVSTASLHHWTDVGAVIASLGRVLRPDGRLWIYDIRLVPAGSVRAAASDLGRRVDRTLVRTGWFPAALFQRLAIQPA